MGRDAWGSGMQAGRRLLVYLSAWQGAAWALHVSRHTACSECAAGRTELLRGRYVPGGARYRCPHVAMCMLRYARCA